MTKITKRRIADLAVTASAMTPVLATALHFIHNPDLAATAQECEAKWTERLTMARHTYTTHGTIAAITRACKCDSITAKKLIAELQSEARP